MPPPTDKPTPKKSANSSLDPLWPLLFQKNIRKIRDFYRAEKFAGQTLGYNTMLEIVNSNLDVALSLALEGKEWEPV